MKQTSLNHSVSVPLGLCVENCAPSPLCRRVNNTEVRERNRVFSLRLNVPLFRMKYDEDFTRITYYTSRFPSAASDMLNLMTDENLKMLYDCVEFLMNGFREAPIK